MNGSTAGRGYRLLLVCLVAGLVIAGGLWGLGPARGSAQVRAGGRNLLGNQGNQKNRKRAQRRKKADAGDQAQAKKVILLRIRPDRLEALFNALDTNSDGSVSLQEFKDLRRAVEQVEKGKGRGKKAGGKRKARGGGGNNA